jgi:GntR family negative regulator for fad regulon and positive regulator of fabA
MKKPQELIEQTLIQEFLNGTPPPGDPLQSERGLAARFGTHRTAVREALRKLAEAGWIRVSPRHATRVNRFWRDGTLVLLTSITRTTRHVPAEVLVHLLEVRAELAPAYTRQAVQNDSVEVIACLARARKLKNTAGAVAAFDWDLQRTLANLSANKFYPLLLNSFAGIYFKTRGKFFASQEFREMARSYYQKLMHAAIEENPDEAETVTRTAMRLRLQIFRRQMQSGETSG